MLLGVARRSLSQREMLLSVAQRSLTHREMSLDVKKIVLGEREMGFCRLLDVRYLDYGTGVGEVDAGGEACEVGTLG